MKMEYLLEKKMTDDELKALIAGLAVAQDRTDEQMKLNAIAQKATD